MPQAASSSPAAGKNVGMAVLAYLGILVIIPLLTDAKKDLFVKFHIKQGLTLLVLFAASFLIKIIPLLGWLVGFVGVLVGLVLLLVGVLNAASGKEKPLPLLGQYADRFKI